MATFLVRFESAIQYVLGKIDTANPELVRAGAIDTMLPHVAGLNDILEQFRDSSDLELLPQADGQVDQILGHLPLLPLSIESDDHAKGLDSAKSFRDEVEALRVRVTGFSESTDAQAQSVGSALAEIQKKADDRFEELDASANQKSEVFTMRIAEAEVEFDKRVAELSQRADSHITRLDAAITGMQESFGRGEKERQTEAEKKSTERDETFKELLARL